MYHVQGLILPDLPRTKATELKQCLFPFNSVICAWWTPSFRMLHYLEESQTWWSGPSCIKSLSLTVKFPKDLQQVDFNHQYWNISPSLLCLHVSLCIWDGSSWSLASPFLAGKTQAAREKRQGRGQEDQSPSTWSWSMTGKYSGAHHIQIRHGHRPQVLTHQVSKSLTFWVFVTLGPQIMKH